jgi:hypothetical protein
MANSEETVRVGAEVDESLPPSSSISFLHALGQSTISQGLTVPVIAQIGWLRDIGKGQRVPVTIRFVGDRTVPAWLRRINNARGHLQFRYESKEQSVLRDYLAQLFQNSGENAVLRITETEPRVFSFEPISAGHESPAFLSLCNLHCHNCTQDGVEELAEFRELRHCLTSIPYDANAGQSEYNIRIAESLERSEWEAETRILEEIGLRCDFEKNGLWVEVEFGNARVYYQDYIKFLMAQRYRQARLGVLLCPTNAFAQLLCELGQKRAIVRRGNSGKKIPSYSGMMSHEKAMRELPFLQFMLAGSVVIGGIEIARRPAKPPEAPAARSDIPHT